MFQTTPTSTNESIANASTSLNAGMASSFDLVGPLVFVVYIVGALLAAQLVAPWLAESRLLQPVSERLKQSLSYAIKGIGATAVLALVGAPIYLVATSDGESQGLALSVLAGLVGVYMALVVIGWLADRAVTRFIDAHPEYDSWEEMWEGEDDATEAAPTAGDD